MSILPSIGIENKPPTGVYLKLADIAKDSLSLGRNPIIVNEIDTDDESIKAMLGRNLHSYYDGSVMDSAPTCDCPPDSYKGLVGRRHLGKICKVCNEEVKAPHEAKLEPHVWIKAPGDVEMLIIPKAWDNLSTILDKPKSISILEWLVNPTYVAKVKDRKALELLAHLERELPNFERSMNYFYRNFNVIVKTILHSAYFRSKGKGKTTPYGVVKKYLENNTQIFTPYLPIPSRVMFVMEANARKVTADPELFQLHDAVHCVAGTETPHSVPLRPKRANSLAVNVQLKLSEKYKIVVKNKLSGKPGIFRQNVYGGRVNFTLRAVLASISGEHDYRGLKLPWGGAVTLYYPRIHAYLTKYKGFTPKQAKRHIYDYYLRFCPIINEFFELITGPNKVVPYSGAAGTNQRNPTLLRGASQFFMIDSIDTDPNNHTTRQSPLTFSIQNADLDGDELNYKEATDEYTKKYYSSLSPHKAINDLNEPFGYNRAIELPNPVIATMVNFLSHGASASI